MQRDPTKELAGTILDGRYQLLSLVGEGKMGVLYKARHQLMDRLVAVKLLQGENSADRLSQERFKKEARVLSSLQHTNIVAVHDFGLSADEIPYLVMDYLSGRSLSALLSEDGPLPASRAAEIFIQVCQGLAHAHARGVLHRDLKPTNILVSKGAGEEVQLKIVDFGIAKLLARKNDNYQRLTVTGEVFGSPHYLSPEQCMGREIDERSDIYSVGCVMYETLTGKRPFPGESALEVATKHCSEPAPPLSAAGAELSIPQDFERVVSKALEKDPNRRYQSMQALSKDLENLLDHATAGSASGSRGVAGRKSRQSLVPNSRIAAIAGAALLSALLALLAASDIGRIELAKLNLSVAEATTEPGNPHQEEALDQLAREYLRQGRASHAVTVYEGWMKQLSGSGTEKSLAYADCLIKLTATMSKAGKKLDAYREQSDRCLEWLCRQANVYLMAHDCPEARKYAQRAYELGKTFPDSPHALATKMERAQSCVCEGRLSDALPYFKEALSYSEEHSGPATRSAFSLIDHIFDSLISTKRFDEVTRLCLLEVSSHQRISPPLSLAEAKRLNYIGDKAIDVVGLSPQSNKNCQVVLKGIVELLRKSLEPGDPLLNRNLARLAALYYLNVSKQKDTSNLSESLAYLERTVTAYKDPCLCPGIVYYYTGALFKMKGDFSKARDILAQGLECARKSKHKDAPYLHAALLEELCVVLCQKHEYKEALPLLKEAVSLWQIPDEKLHDREGPNYLKMKDMKLKQYKALIEEANTSLGQAGDG